MANGIADSGRISAVSHHSFTVKVAERVGLLAADAARPSLRSGPLPLRGNVQIALAICRTHVSADRDQ
jgi:hypothetical protein